ncbi:MAG: M56 family metallopeptidase [Planctomycetota bacterium]
MVTEFDWRSAGIVSGTTVLLAVGSLAVLAFRQPVYRQRIAELSIVLTALWLILATVPLPRLSTRPVVATVTTSPVSDADPWQAVVSRPRLERDSADLDSRSFQATAPDVSTGSAAEATDLPIGRTSDLNPHPSLAVRHVGWARWVWIGYLAVASVFLFCFLLGRVLLSYSFRTARVPPESVATEYERIATGRLARIRISDWCKRPVSYGIFRPTIVLPEILCDPDRQKTLRHVLLHEQTHVDRRDAIGNALMNAAAPLLWFHPLYWYLRSTATFARELIADDQAATGSDKLTYVNDLLELIRLPASQFLISPVGIGVFGFRHPFTRRMSLLLNRNQPLESTMKRTSTIAICATGLLLMLPLAALLGTQTTLAQESESVTEEASAVIAEEPAVGEPVASTQESGASEVEFRALAINGSIVAVNDFTAFAPQDGQVKEIPVQPGTLVKKGDVLVRLENLSLVQESLTIRQKLRQTGTLASARAMLQSAEAKVLQTRKDLERTKQLHEKNIVSDSEYQSVAQKAREAEYQRAVEEAAMDNAVELARALDKQEQLIQDRIAALQIRSPIDGVVEQMAVQPSEVVAKGTSLFRVIDLAKVRVRCHVPIKEFSPADLSGKIARIDVELANETLQVIGKVSFVGSTVDLSGSMQVWIDFDNVQRGGNWLIRPGMLCKPMVVSGEDTSDGVSRDGSSFWQPVPTDNAKVERLQAEEVELLKELVEQHNETYRLAKASLEQGTGNLVGVAESGRDLSSAEAKLAIAEGRLDDADEAFKNAVEYALSATKSTKRVFEQGTLDALSVLQAQRRATEIQLEYVQFKKRFER